MAKSFRFHGGNDCDLQLYRSTLAKVDGQKRGLSDLEGHLITRWGQAPFALGSYAYHRPNKHTWQQAPPKPVAECVFFAGEACSRYIGTVHGAYLSGLQTAKAVIASS